MKNKETFSHGYMSLQSTKVLVPSELAIAISNVNIAAGEIWTALELGRNPDGTSSKRGEHSQDASEIDVDAFVEPQTSASKPVMKLNSTALQRLENLITQFAARSKRSIYNNGQRQGDESSAQPNLEIEHAENYEHGYINRVGDANQSAQAKRFGTNKKNVTEHNVLDLYLHACKHIPGFGEASTRTSHPQQKPAACLKPVAPIPYDGTEPAFQFESPLLNEEEILPSELNNSLVVGSTGSGKTVSFLLPVMHALLQYRVEDRSSSMLIIDPKVELLKEVTTRLLDLGEMDRLLVVGETDPIEFFSEDDDLSLEDRYRKARKLVASDSRGGDDGRWAAMADRLLLSLFRDSEAFASVVGVGLLEALACAMTGDETYLHANEWIAVRKVLILGMEGHEQIKLLSDLYDVLCTSVGLTNLDRPLARYASITDQDQFFYNSRSALIVADPLGGSDIPPLLDLSITRTRRNRQLCNIAEAIERGAVIVFQPRAKATHDLVGAALKSLFYRASMSRKDMLRPMGLVCDEAQRFISADPESGEHTFLDRCRAYRVNVVMATQSMAALQTAVGTTPGGQSALDSIVVNTPTKACFRTTDFSATQMMKSFIPADPYGTGHVLAVRPPSSLAVGECYFALGKNWGRSHYALREKKPTMTEIQNQKQGEKA